MFKPNENLLNLSFAELNKYFVQLMDSLSLKYGYHTVFDDLLDCGINGLSFNYSESIMKAIQKKYNQDERYIFGEMIKIWIAIMNIKVDSDKSYYDFFGHQYEQLAMSKKNGFAQYFTPEVICTFMAQIVSINKDEVNQTVAEPACGSGRMNLALHANNHKLFHYANDLDYTCAKMTALNFAIHGVKGIVTCDDGLFPFSKFRGAFIINYRTAPFIEYISDAESLKYFFKYFMPKRTEILLNNDISEEIKQSLDSSEIISLSQLGQQLSLF